MKLNHLFGYISSSFALAVICWMWIDGRSLSSIMEKNSADDTSPDFVITQVYSQQFNEQGQLKYTLRAKELAHYPDGSAHLTLPQLELNDAAQSVWRASAQTGQVNDATHTAELNQGVLLNQPFAKKTQNWQLKTEHLSIDLDHSLVETDQPVHIQHALGQLEAQGMRSNLTTHQMDLLAHVRGHYEVQ